MIIAIIFLVSAFQMNACELTSLLTKKTFTVSTEVAGFVPGLRGKQIVTFIDTTEQGLKHLNEFCVRQYQMDKKEKGTLGHHREEPEQALSLYVSAIIEPELVSLTKNASILFPQQQPMPRCLIEKWSAVIEENNYGLEHVLGLFTAKDVDVSLGEKIWDAYAEQKGLLSSQKLIESSINGENLPENMQELGDDKNNENEDKKPSLSAFAVFKSAISQRWSQMGYLKKWVIGGGLPFLAVVCLYLQYRK